MFYNLLYVIIAFKIYMLHYITYICNCIIALVDPISNIRLINVYDVISPPFFTTAQQPYWTKASPLSRIHDYTQTHHTW